MVAKLLTVLGLTAVLAGCATTEPTTAIITAERPQLTVPEVDNIKLREIEWHVISEKAKPGEKGSADAAFRKSNSSSLFALSAKDYEDISVNTANLLKVIKQYQAQVRAYKQYYLKEEGNQPKEQGNASKAAPR